MFIVYGWGKTTESIKGYFAEYECMNCHKMIRRELVRRRTWFTIFFIPVIPYRTEYFLRCPCCQWGASLEKEQFLQLCESVNVNTH